MDITKFLANAPESVKQELTERFAQKKSYNDIIAIVTENDIDIQIDEYQDGCTLIEIPKIIYNAGFKPQPVYASLNNKEKMIVFQFPKESGREKLEFDLRKNGKENKFTMQVLQVDDLGYCTMYCNGQYKQSKTDEEFYEQRSHLIAYCISDFLKDDQGNHILFYLLIKGLSAPSFKQTYNGITKDKLNCTDAVKQRAILKMYVEDCEYKNKEGKGTKSPKCFFVVDSFKSISFAKMYNDFLKDHFLWSFAIASELLALYEYNASAFSYIAKITDKWDWILADMVAAANKKRTGAFVTDGENRQVGYGKMQIDLDKLKLDKPVQISNSNHLQIQAPAIEEVVLTENEEDTLPY